MKGTFTPAGGRAAHEERWRSAGLWTDEPLIETIERAVAVNPSTQLVFASADRPSQSTTGEVLARSAKVAAGLHALGLRAGDIVVSQTPHWQEGVELVLAALRLGLIVVPVVHIYGPAELGFLLRQTRARALVLPDSWSNIDYADRVARLGDLPDLKHVIVLGEGAMPGPSISWRNMLALGGGEDGPRTPGKADDICLILFTSGTTSAPKGVLHSQRGLAAEIRQSSVYIDPAKPGAMMATLPAGHIGGLTASLRPFVSFENVVYIDRWNLPRALDAIECHQVVRTICTPFHVNALIDSGRIKPGRLHLVVGGAGVAPSLVERADRAGISAYRSWGSTEHPSVTTSLADDPLGTRANCDGHVMAGCELRIVDDEGDPVPAGERGEILSIGPELFSGYLDSSLNEAAFTADGWFRTGDIGILDEQGRLTIVDRKKDIIIRGGENISSKEVEDALLQHPRIAEAAAVGWPDEVYGERVGAFVQLSEGDSLTIEELAAHFASLGVARQKTPEHLVLIDDFPRNQSGKILKHELRNRIKALMEQQRVASAA
jgi:acyl-CoA synthetase (AMP-forming)/AMP-acid ligase II